MRAAHAQQLRLLDLQDIDTKLLRLSRSLDRLPEAEERTALQQKLAEHKPAFRDAQRTVDDLRADIDRVIADAATVASRRQRNEERLAGSVSPKEAVSLQSEIVALDQRNTLLEARELELMQQLEDAEARLREAEERLSGAQSDLAGVDQRLADAQRRIQDDIVALQDERDNVAAEITGDLRDLYDTIRERTGIGVARLRGGVSEASNLALSPGELRAFIDAPKDDVLFCPQTGAILVRVADDSESAGETGRA